MTNVGAMMLFVGMAVSFVQVDIGMALLGTGFILAVAGRMSEK